MSKGLKKIIALLVGGGIILVVISKLASVQAQPPPTCQTGYHWDGASCVPDIPDQITYYLTLTSDVGGTTNPVPNIYPIQKGGTWYFNAIANTNYKFVYWLLDGAQRTDNPIGVTPTSDISLSAVFGYVAPPPTVHSVRLASNSGGTTNPIPNLYEVQAGQNFVATAIADTNYRFVYWSVDGVQSTENPIQVTPTSDISLSATFEYVEPPPSHTHYDITINSSSGGTSNPPAGHYTGDNTLTITAIPDSGYSFDHWNLNDGYLSSDTTINADLGPWTVTPFFTAIILPEYPLDVGITIWGTAPYFNVQNAISEFKNFIEQNSKLRLNLTVTAHPPLENSEYRSFDTAVFPYLDNLTANTKSYLTHRVNILMFDPENRTLAFGGLAWLPPTRLAIIPLKYAAEPPWQVQMASALTHEFLHTINVDSQSCPALGYNESNDPGWQRCYKYLLSLLTDADYHAIVGY